MFLHEINLLPPQIIQVRVGRIYLRQAGRLVRFVIFLAGLLLLLLGGVYIVIWRMQILVAADRAADHDGQAAIATGAGKVNAQLGALQNWRAANAEWTPLAPQVLLAMPDGVQLTSVSVDREKSLLEVKGIFSRREVLVTFQRRLEELAWVEKVESPLSNFETGRATQFSLLVYRLP